MNWCSAEYNLLTSAVIVNLVPALLASAVVYADDPPLVKLMGRKYSSDEAGDGPEVRVTRRARADRQINGPTDTHADTHTRARAHTHTQRYRHARAHTETHAPMHTQTQTHTHPHRHADSHRHTRRHTRTQTRGRA